jgi:two-component system invasion response regulator UvrY
MRKQIAVIIAEDNHLMRGSLRLIIDGMNSAILVGEAANGEEALALCQEKNPDIVLMDINMSPVNGFEATRKIIKQYPNTKVIALSMHNKVSYAKNMLKLGAFGYVCKSSPHSDIIEAIETVMNGGIFIDKGLQGQADWGTLIVSFVASAQMIQILSK